MGAGNSLAPPALPATLPNWSWLPIGARHRARLAAQSAGPLLGSQLVHSSTLRGAATRVPAANDPVQSLRAGQPAAVTRHSGGQVEGPGQAGPAPAYRSRGRRGERGVSARSEPIAAQACHAAGVLASPTARQPAQLLAWRPGMVATVWPQLTRLVEREVTRRTRAAAPAPAPPAEAARSSAPPVPAGLSPEVTDRMVAQVITRLRALAREERFRAGRLR